ncbi:MAG: uL15 family ribosomal protein [Candidatus Nealsonbacteria bacterium]|nr:uL15 family ribosomal protein [Candidatus Nealsonbacteria bacterium]
MQIHEIHPKRKLKKGKRVGRGGNRGTYSGKGVKGQNSRSGRKFQPAIRELIKRYPKLRGYRFSARGGSAFGGKVQVVNLDVIEKNFETGQTINPQILLEKRIIRRIEGRLPQVKILGDGKIAKALAIENCLVSKQAKEKIEAANGSIK